MGAAGACVRRGRGCPVPDTGGSGQIRLVPASSATAPVQGTAQPISNAGGTSVETSSERAKWRTAEQSEGKSVRNSPESTKVSGGEGAGGAAGAVADIPLKRVERHAGAGGCALRELQPVEGPPRSREKCEGEEEGAAERSCGGLTTAPPYSLSPCPALGGGCRSWECSEVVPGKKVGESSCFNFVFVSCHPALLQINFPQIMPVFL